MLAVVAVAGCSDTAGRNDAAVEPSTGRVAAERDAPAPETDGAIVAEPVTVEPARPIALRFPTEVDSGAPDYLSRWN